jgi:hypothetical protein
MDIISIFILSLFIVGWFCLIIYIDKRRIFTKAEENGWQDIQITWTPFAPGFLFDRYARHYLINYQDENGNWKKRYCRTNFFTGVYWRDED